MPDTPDTPEVEDLMRYDVLAQEALRGVVKTVLQEVAHTGLPGEHHFYITFNTNHSGVRLSIRMKEKYPEEMTIVIQHQYWDLETSELGFSIGLSFDNIPETMRIPYAAISGFFDPAVQFGLQFDATANEQESEDEGEDNISALPAPPTIAQIEKKTPKAKSKAKAKAGKKTKTAAKAKKADDADETETNSAEVVSLDAFRKK